MSPAEAAAHLSVPPPDAGPAAMRVRPAGAADQAAWDAFVDAVPEGTFFHRWGWARAIEKGLGHAPRYLLAERAGRTVGVLPLVLKKSPIFGNALISTAFCSYGGAVGVDEPARRALEDAAEAMAVELGVDYLEMRNMAARRDDWVRKDAVYATFKKPIADSDEKIVKAIPSKGRRYDVKRSQRNGLALEVHDGLDAFYDVFAESYRNLGTPVFSRRYLDLLLAAFPKEFEVQLVRGPDGYVAGSMVFHYKGEAHPYYTGGRATARKVQGNDFLFLKMMGRARERGCTVFDFGRSKFGTGSFEYKTFWGFTPQPLVYEYRMVRKSEAPDLNPLNPRFRLFVEGWKRLPLGVSKILGPPLVRQIG